MAGRGRAPKSPDQRKNPYEKPTHEWQPTTESGWQHGPIPPAPDGLKEASAEAWRIWFEAWFAAHWLPSDLPGLRQLVRVYDEVERGEFQRHGELRIGMDTYGITPKGQQDRRWKPPEAEKDEPSKPEVDDRRSRLKVV